MQNPTKQAQILPMTGTIDTHIGSLSFEGVYPTSETVAKPYDEFDFQRAVQTYLWAIPLVSFASWQEAHETVFGQEDGDLVLMTSFRDRLGFNDDHALSTEHGLMILRGDNNNLLHHDC